jgi:alpha-L-fucosidase
VMPRINPDPWQTDTSIGDWYYNKNWKFRPVRWTIHMLADIVSKNGNLLLNVVQRPDGSLDPEVEQMLEQMAQWIAVHGEAIYGTRPWLVYGEGGVRFTTKGPVLYAIALGWPADGKLVIRSLATPAGKVQAVSLLGYDGSIDWQQTGEGLVAKVPAQKVSEYTCALRILGEDLKPAPIPEVAAVVAADAKGNFTLSPDDADLHGDQIKLEAQGGRPNVGFWDKPEDWVSWKVKFDKPGVYRLSASCSTVHAGAEFVVEVGPTPAGQQLVGKPPRTSGWADFRLVDLGRIEVKQPGELTIKVRSRDAASWKAINLRGLRLTKAAGPAPE